MRYADSHKEETHRKVLKLAARALREKGPDRLAVAEVMKAAGLTHGGFYAHFKSKDDFLAEAVSETFAQAGRRWERILEGMAPREALATYVDYYVSETHRENPSTGCPVVALNSDLPRQSKSFRKAFDEGLKRLVANLERRMTATGIENAATLAPSILAEMVGAVALSRAVSDRAHSDGILAGTRDDIKTRLGVNDIGEQAHE